MSKPCEKVQKLVVADYSGILVFKSRQTNYAFSRLLELLFYCCILHQHSPYGLFNKDIL